MGNIKSRALLYLYFVNLFIKKQSTPHHRDKQRKSRKRAVSNRPKKPILRQPRFSDKMNLAKGEKHYFETAPFFMSTDLEGIRQDLWKYSSEPNCGFNNELRKERGWAS